MEKFNYLSRGNAEYIEELLERYNQDPESIDSTWRYLFDGIEIGKSSDYSNGLSNGHGGTPLNTTVDNTLDLFSEVKVAELIFAYREFGKLVAHLDPLNPAPASHPYLELARFGLTTNDLTKSFHAGKLLGLGATPLSQIVSHLKKVYSGSIAIEATHIPDPIKRDWIQKKIENQNSYSTLPGDTKKWILSRLSESEGFEKFLHTRYVAQKRFSAEGGESIITALDCLIEKGSELGIQEFDIGMAHRGRLNVLTNIMGKKPEFIFLEFDGNYKVDPSQGEGDVKYHKGYSHDRVTKTGKTVHLSLAFNPSHLEVVNPVVEGIVRAKQYQKGDKEQNRVMPVLIHGDAAFAGQGVCYETLNLTHLSGYSTGGTFNIIINNQVGFTTSPIDSRSTLYCTDLAKMMDSPIFHVNGDDPESVWRTVEWCLEYRNKFKTDVFIDIVCYRKYGHNEGDEPSFTQPLMYKTIKSHPTTRTLYAEKLMSDGTLTQIEAQLLQDEITKKFEDAQALAKSGKLEPKISAFEGNWKGLKTATDEDIFAPASTQVSAETLKSLSGKINRFPDGFTIHPKLSRFFESRVKAVSDGEGIDWGNAEALAFATLLNDGKSVRLSGQDAERGTFTHRHCVLSDFETGHKNSPIQNASQSGSQFMVHNSSLSETGVLGFEYGYSLAAPHALTIWEAQFGDFANGAQIVIDQFISTGESKWLRMSGLTLLLPHGFEGQGPEHSSARLERFLSLCGRYNMQVCNLSTPAQLFHAFRRQVVRTFRKPLIIMSPKSLLRHPNCVSKLEDFTNTGFQEIIDDSQEFVASAKKIHKIILCTGKIYYELLAERTLLKINDTVIIRVEQIYPWPGRKLSNILSKYSEAKDIVWVQEEPRNMGAWPFIFGTWLGGLEDFSGQVQNRGIRYLGRDVGAAPAVGSHKLHESQQKFIIEKAFT